MGAEAHNKQVQVHQNDQAGEVLAHKDVSGNVDTTRYIKMLMNHLVSLISLESQSEDN